jgi:hypothetical protein
MHIAVLVYGRLNKCIEHYDNIIHAIGQDNQIDFFMSSDNSPIVGDFIKTYNPIAYINEPIEYKLDFGTFNGKRLETNISNMTRHFINKYRVFNLLEEHVKRTSTEYDIIISLRVDLVFQNKIQMTGLEPNTIYIPEGNDFIENAINDQLALGSFQVMKSYSNIYMNAFRMLQMGITIPHPESLNYANIVNNNIHIQRFPLKYYIDR